MVDSANFNIEGVYLDLNNLKNMKVRFKIIKDKGIISFSLDNVKFTYYMKYRNLAIETTAYRILKRTDITLTDKDIFKREINNILNKVFNTKGIDFNMTLTRFDYFVDLKLDSLKDLYMFLLKQHKARYKYMSETKEYETSKYVKTGKGSGQRTMNLYDKEEEISNNRYTIRELFGKKYKGVLRLEVQNYKRKLKREYKVNHVLRNIDIYWTRDAMEEYYFKLLEDYLFRGDYYKISSAATIIEATDYNDKWKGKLITFLKNIQLEGIDNINKLYATNTIKRYIEKLNKLEINPITLPDDCEYDMLEGLYSLIRKKAERDYFI